MRTRLRQALARVVDLREGEARSLLLSAGYFFFLLASYYVLRPLREEMGVRSGQESLTWLYMGTLTGMLVFNPVFGALVSRLTRRVFIPVVYRFLMANLLVFYLLLTSLDASGRLAVARVFFVWVSVFNLFAISVFWGFMADLHTPEEGKRLFGFVSVGGTLGAVAGAGLTALLVKAIGPYNLILVATVLLEIAVLCVKRLSRLHRVDEVAVPKGAAVVAPAAVPPPGGESEGVPPGRGMLHGMRLVATTPYLLGICVFLFLFTLSATFVYFEQARIVRAAFQDSAARTAFFARIDLTVNVLCVLLQLFVTGRLIRFLGVGGTLAALPLLSLGLFVALAASPTAATILLVQAVRRSTEYAVFRPAREVLFTVVTREEKYSSKAFIDTFVYRTGDAFGAWGDRLLKAFALPGATLAAALVPIAAVWSVVAVLLGREQAKRAAARDRGEGAAAPA